MADSDLTTATIMPKLSIPHVYGYVGSVVALGVLFLLTMHGYNTRHTGLTLKALQAKRMVQNRDNVSSSTEVILIRVIASVYEVAKRNPEQLGYRISAIMWVKAAYFDTRIGTVTLLMYPVRNFPFTFVRCSLYDEFRRLLLSTSGRLVVDRYYPTFKPMLYCTATSFLDGNQTSPSYVSVDYNTNGGRLPKAHSTLIPVKQLAAANGRSEGLFAACLGPLYGDASYWLSLIQYLEFIQIQGATRVFVYYCEGRPEIRRILDHYVDTGLVEVDGYPCDTPNCPRPNSCKQTAYNHCVYKTIHRFKYLFISDFDELLMPVSASQTLAELLLAMDRPNYCSFQFHSRWFERDKEWDIDWMDFDRKKLKNLHLYAPLSRYTNGSNTLSIYKTLPKTVVKPDKTLYAWIHMSQQTWNCSLQYLVPDTLAWYRHIRQHAKYMDRVAKLTYSQQPPPDRLTYKLLSRMKQIILKLKFSSDNDLKFE